MGLVHKSSQRWRVHWEGKGIGECFLAAEQDSSMLKGSGKSTAKETSLDSTVLNNYQLFLTLPSPVSAVDDLDCPFIYTTKTTYVTDFMLTIYSSVLFQCHCFELWNLLLRTCFWKNIGPHRQLMFLWRHSATCEAINITKSILTTEPVWVKIIFI